MTDAHLYLLPEPAVEAFAARYGGPALLTADERAQLARRRTPGARRRYLGARVLCRYALSARSHRPPHAWRFRTGPHGRPEPQAPADGLRFNLSHTEGMLACLVTETASCGVDVERTPVGQDALRHLPRYLAAAERAALAAAPPAARPAALAAYWVLKEAYLKALGTGLRRDLAGFAFSPPQAGPIELTDPAGTPAAWRFELLHPAPGFVLAAAVEHGRGGRLHRTLLTA
ncbi:4'-phosphopantetheinyl transferase superfamily protein [Kitasatospora sp. NBC_01287]|uniref:4'-phosphopantetheinyl transferase superfamily protein n=1 Tax=Kitasatospora sp. NBC_01287 TaxID=2903573 RepID=UPI00224D0A11|nr:4'-phosphopantetheinyl transferase superfamily protein [Kitasatospora sp. NBC_01287]MCX4748429.1 4'-phosphopantetheinyl transferase superfamily protein [Kitasatospora sp. NBC_01287]